MNQKGIRNRNDIRNRMFILATIIFSTATILISMLNLFKNISFFENEIVQVAIVITAICLIVLGIVFLIKGLKQKG